MIDVQRRYAPRGVALAWLSAVLLLPPSGGAQEPAIEEAPSRYAVEIILFRYDDSVSAGSEIFLPSPPPDGEPDSLDTEFDTPYFGDLPEDRSLTGEARDEFGSAVGEELVPEESDVDAGPPPAPPTRDADASLSDQELAEIVTGTQAVDFRLLDEDERTLEGVYRRLRQIDAYEPVLWTGWTQVVRDRESTPAINLRRLGAVPLEFDGELTLYLGRFVHLVADLRLMERAARSAAPTGDDVPYYGDEPRGFGFRGSRYAPTVTYRISEDQILRNGDMRYYDHPKFGLIAHLALIEEEKPGDPLLDDSGDLLPANPANGVTLETPGSQ